MITYKSNQRIEGRSFQNVFIIVTLDGIEYEVNASAPSTISDQDIAEYIRGQHKWAISVAKTIYPNSPLESFDTLETWKQWIADGCWIDDETQAEKVEWTNKHPVEVDLFDRKKPSVETKAKLQALVDVLPEAQVLMDMLIGG